MTDTPLRDGAMYLGNGLPISALRKLLAEWPDRNDRGEPTTVWIGTRESTSNEVGEVTELGDGDLILWPRP